MSQGERKKVSRRAFIRQVGASAAGLFLAPQIARAAARAERGGTSSLTQVAITRASEYDRLLVRERVEHLFDSLGGITDLMRVGKKVAIKINLTGGSSSALSPKLNGLPITESMWTHPEVLRAVGELIVDCGVRGTDIYFVEALWDQASYDSFGYRAVQQSLGAQMINLNNSSPYPAFVQKSTGSAHFLFSSFTVNQILADVDVYVSLPKMKEHYEAGVTASLKNQVGMVPKQLYVIPSDQGRRSRLHSADGGSSASHLPRAVCDLAGARPVHLAVIDGIKNARGGEGVWNPTFRLAEDHVLLAGKEPVAADSIAAYLMGHDPQTATLSLPGGGACDNYLDLLHLQGVGTNQMSEIQPVGDGAGLVTSVPAGADIPRPVSYELRNFPNPFNQRTMITFVLPSRQAISLKIFNPLGEELSVVSRGDHGPGKHSVAWDAEGLPSGTYFCRLQAGSGVQTRSIVLIR